MKATTKAKEKYNNKKYDRITFRVYKGQKELIELASKKTGKSINAFITELVLDKIFEVLCNEEKKQKEIEATTEEWMAEKIKKWKELPKAIKPKSHRLIGMRSLEKERRILENGRIKKEKFEEFLRKEGITYE